ncbi:YesL family protein [Oceanobacillus chungangensis]|uniref:DUF624 domain-containing protein n=1 Tax=Oceanobacillus chungangensis TaxID=1229152 RepID=A0A3D8PX01_9BACI|nr:DUF624 domain-containing protein [Oceanobacillus chungangensis]RDW20623.1 hypothetical protein CWR45_05155 [Oceanobacillus chungangensis]
MNTINAAIYNILEWITRFAYINLLWILFTLLGGVIFGFFPSTIAMFAIVRDWLRGKSDFPILKSFWKYYRGDFLKSNQLGIFISLITAIITINLFFIQLNTLDWLTWTYAPLFAFILVFVLFLFYIFPAFVHFDLKIFKLIKNAFLIMLVNPIQTILMLLSLVSIFFIMYLIPPLFFIFGGSSYAFITMWLCLNIFNKITENTAK